MKLTIITRPLCPYCSLLMEALAGRREKEGVELTYLQDGQPEARAYDYYYLPAVFLDGKRVLHGKAEPEQIRALPDQVMREKQA